MSDKYQSDQASEHKSDQHYWLALNRILGVGPISAAKLLAKFETPKALFTASRSDLQSTQLSPKLIEQILTPDWDGVEDDLAWCDVNDDHYIVTPDDQAYPDLLKELVDAPIVLFVNGELNDLSMPQLAMVGSRSPSPAGKVIAKEFGAELNRCGLIVTSGMALGIDAAAHEGALEAGGHTLAVLGTGPDQIYPARHLGLAERIKQQGAIVTEFVPGTGPRKEHFPRRNRLISGLSLGTLVVEATERSGSLITARLASEQGREVFAIPGSIRNAQSRGCHRIIKEGAKLVESVQDIFDELEAMTGFMRADLGVEKQVDIEGEKSAGADDKFSSFLDKMGYDPLSIDEIVRRSGLTASDVSSMLLTLELQGRVSSQHGGLYQRLQ